MTEALPVLHRPCVVPSRLTGVCAKLNTIVTQLPEILAAEDNPPPSRAEVDEQKNAELRTREHLTPDEVEALIEAAKGNRYGHRAPP
jgi:hypothetical protein